MNNVERKLILDFKEWRLQENRNETTKETIKKDAEEFMQTRFQIKPSQTEQEHPLNILDILDTMIAPDVDVSLHVNSIRENAIACEDSSQIEEDNSDLSFPCCSDPRFTFSGKKCFHVSSDRADYEGAVNACKGLKAELASISSAAEDEMVYRMMTENGATGHVFIGLTNVDGNFIWQDGSTLESYINWASWETSSGKLHQEPNDGNGACVEKMIWNDQKGKWGDRDRDHECNVTRRYACSIAAHESCDTKKSSAMRCRKGCVCKQTIPPPLKVRRRTFQESTFS